MPIPSKPCPGELSQETQRLLRKTRDRTQWGTYPCKVCGRVVGVEEAGGRWIASVAPEHSHDDSFADAMLESDPNKLLMGMRSVLLKTARMSAYVSMTDSKGQRPRDPTDKPKPAPVV